jgi:hypothetical protein
MLSYGEPAVGPIWSVRAAVASNDGTRPPARVSTSDRRPEYAEPVHTARKSATETISVAGKPFYLKGAGQPGNNQVLPERFSVCMMLINMGVDRRLISETAAAFRGATSHSSTTAKDEDQWLSYQLCVLPSRTRVIALKISARREGTAPAFERIDSQPAPRVLLSRF